MSILKLHIPTPQEAFEDELWVSEQCYRFYVRQRRIYCDFLTLLDLWLRAPYCVRCAQSEPGLSYGPPEISEDSWHEDMAWHLGQDVADSVEAERATDADYGVPCKRCGVSLRPWDGDDIHIVDYHLEEHYGIPMETSGKKNPSRRVRRRVFTLYGDACFRCGRRRGLHIDHIMPRAKGGDAAFRNLQPLCEECGVEKADRSASEVTVYLPLYFQACPSDGYEDLFW